MVHIVDVWSELWTKSRTALQNRSLRRKRIKKHETIIPKDEQPKKVPQNARNECVNYQRVKGGLQFVKNHPLRKSTHTCSARKHSGEARRISFNDDTHIYHSIGNLSASENQPKLVKCLIYESAEMQTLPLINNVTLSPAHSTPNQKADESESFLSNVDEISPIAKSSASSTEIPESSPLGKSNNTQCRRNLEDRFVVNAYSYRSGCFSLRKPRKIDETQLIRVEEDMNQQTKQKESINGNSNVISEMYRARITPDKILAQTILKQQKRNDRRIVSQKVLDFLDKTSKKGDALVQTLHEHATEIEKLQKDVDVDGPIYATPDKTKKLTKELSQQSDLQKVGRSTESLQNDTFFKLKEEADYQCKIMRQASKAVEVSRRRSDSAKNIDMQVEAEKILLTANCKYEQIMQEIRQSHYETPLESKHLGTIEVANVCFKLSSYFPSEQSGWFVLILMDGKRILCSTAVEVKVGEEHIKFDQTFRFDNLEGTFEIIAKIYCLRSGCFARKSEKRLSTKLRKYRYMDVYTRDFVENNIVTSSFVPSAYFKLAVSDLHAGGVFNVTKYENSPLSGLVELRMRLVDMQIAAGKCGLVNMRATNDPTVWKRRWCTMSDTVLKFWNSPMDEAFNEPPILHIDMAFCRQEVDTAKRTLCPRAKTLALVTSKGAHYINLDTSADLKDWKKSLNDVYHALCEWKMLRV